MSAEFYLCEYRRNKLAYFYYCIGNNEKDIEGIMYIPVKCVVVALNQFLFVLHFFLVFCYVHVLKSYVNKNIVSPFFFLFLADAKISHHGIFSFFLLPPSMPLS
jgi:hypothetical protein